MRRLFHRRTFYTGRRLLFPRTICKEMAKISDISYLTPSEVLQLVRAGNSIVVIDVREDDRKGGHIKGSKHIPAPTFKSKPAQFLSVSDGKEYVVFHCMFSQYRGPSCARAFVEAWNRDEKRKSPAPKICILAGGFNAVSKLALQGKDVDVIEDFDKRYHS